MKKYNVYSLSVIKVTKNGLTYRFICKKNLFNSKVYNEVLTGEEITPASDEDITFLASYYPPIATRNFETGEPLMLDRHDILRKYIDINSETIKEREAVNCDNNKLLNIDEILDKAVSSLFPKKGNWGSDCFDRPETLGIPYIPCHARDDEWMAKLIRKINDLNFISLGRVIEYVKSSEFYKNNRHAYELEVVRWQIEWMMNGGDNWIVEDEYGGDFISFDESGDIGFRRSIFKTLTQIGMDSDVVEEGIEKYASMWRDSWINRAFRNHFEPILGQVIYPLYDGQNVPPVAPLPPASEELKEKWIRLRKYEYYRDNKDSVDKYGEADGDMLMSSDEAEELRKEVRELSIERQREISAYKKERDKKLTEHRQFIKKKETTN